MTELYDRRFDVGTTTSTAYTHVLTGATGCEGAFTALEDGEVWINSRCQLANSAGEATCHAIEIRDSDSVIRHASDPIFCQGAELSDEDFTWLELRVTGLKPGRQYKVRQMFRVNGGTGTVGRRKLTVREEAP